jgi:type IV pilus assembly protein PilZ
MTEPNTTGAVSASGLRSSMLQFSAPDVTTLYAHYTSRFQNGGIFVPTNRTFELGAEVIVALTLPGREERFAIGGRVAWVTPANAQHGRSQGVGVAFETDDKSKAVRAIIEDMLGSMLTSGRGTQTF